MPTWFHKLFGVTEKGLMSRQAEKSSLNEFVIRDQFVVTPQASHPDFLEVRSLANDRVFPIGKFSTPTLGQLREQGKIILATNNNNSEKLGKINIFHESVTDLVKFHNDNAGNIFQAASQFNCLEFSSPSVIPEDGITIYEYDHTQGPSCAIACAAGTLYRNYLYPFPNGQIGQTKDLQINNLDELELYLSKITENNNNNNENEKNEKFWNIENGYTFSTEKQLLKLNKLYLNNSNYNSNELISYIKIGIHESVGITHEKLNSIHSNIDNYNNIPLLVTQVYCSALSCAYSGISIDYWKLFAKLILYASYEATLWTGILYKPINYDITKPIKIYLTFLGGGVFGNDIHWILEAIANSIIQFELLGAQLDIVITHYRTIDYEKVELLNHYLEIMRNQK